MSQTQPPDAGSPSPSVPSLAEAPLPLEARSVSEILRASHVLLVEIRAVRASEWEATSPDDQKRHLDMDIALVETLKGTTRLNDGAVFRVEVDQLQGSPRLPPANVWSALSPAPGSRFLFVSNGQLVSNGQEPVDPAELLAPAAVVRVSSGAQAVEVHLAKRAERLFINVRDSPDPGPADRELAASRAIIALAQENIASLGDIFGRYLCARVLPSFARSPDRPVSELAALLTSPTGTFPFKIELTAGLDQAGIDLGGDPLFLRAVVRAYFEMLLDPALANMHHRLVQVSLYLLIFPEDDEGPRPRADDVLPDAAARARYEKALGAHPNERGKALAHWLSQTGSRPAP